MCNCNNHSIDCNCDMTGIVKNITINPNQHYVYSHCMYALLEDDFEYEMNEIIKVYGSLEAACFNIPYVPVYFDRYGDMQSSNGDNSALYTNLLHIILADRKEEERRLQFGSVNPVYNSKVFTPFTQLVDSNIDEEGISLDIDHETDSSKDEEFIDVNFTDTEERDDGIVFDGLHELPKVECASCEFEHPNLPNNPFASYPGYPSYNPNFYSNYCDPYADYRPIPQPMSTARATMGGKDITNQIMNTPNVKYTDLADLSNLIVDKPGQNDPYFSLCGTTRRNKPPQQNNTCFTPSEIKEASESYENLLANMEHPEDDTPDSPLYVTGVHSQNPTPSFNPDKKNTFDPSKYVNPFMRPRQEYHQQYRNRYGEDRSWLFKTPEELEALNRPIVTVIKKGDKIEEEPEIIYKPKPRVPKIVVAVVRTITDDDGVTWEEFVSGNKDIIPTLKTKEMALSEKKLLDDYKSKSIESKSNNAKNNLYLLVKELARYNEELANELLWYMNNAPLEDFLEMQNECKAQLIKYRNADPAASLKSMVLMAGDEINVRGPMDGTINNFKNVSKEAIRKTTEQKEQDMIDKTINKYTVGYWGDTQNRILSEDKPPLTIIKKLQSLTNLRVIPYEKDRAARVMRAKLETTIAPTRLELLNKYKIWKKITKIKWGMQGKDLSNFDKEFDEWWNLPYTQNRPKPMGRRDYIEFMTAKKVNHIAMMQNAKSPAEIDAELWDRAKQIQYERFTKGMNLRPDMGVKEFFSLLPLMETRILEYECEKQRNEVRNLYDHEAFINLVDHYSALDNEARGMGYVPTIQLLDPKEYKRKEQAFIDQIFKHEKRGAICGS